MKFRLLVIIGLLFYSFCSNVLADQVVLKSGENKKGKIIEVNNEKILLNSDTDGMVVEIPRNKVAILDRDVVSEDEEKSKELNFFTQAPKTKPRTYEIYKVHKDSSVDVTEKSFQKGFSKEFSKLMHYKSLDDVMEAWMSDHPEVRKIVDNFKKVLAGKNEELDKAVRVAQENA